MKKTCMSVSVAHRLAVGLQEERNPLASIGEGYRVVRSVVLSPHPVCLLRPQRYTTFVWFDLEVEGGLKAKAKDVVMGE